MHTGILCFVLFPDSFAATPTRAITSSLIDKRRMRQVTHFKILLKQTAKQVQYFKKSPFKFTEPGKKSEQPTHKKH